MWIRSQDKESLRQYKGIFIDGTDKKNICGDNFVDTKSWFILGQYKSEERAKEVLDDIQHYLADICYYKLKASSGLMDWESFIETNSCVYEMPKE